MRILNFVVHIYSSRFRCLLDMYSFMKKVRVGPFKIVQIMKKLEKEGGFSIFCFVSTVVQFGLSLVSAFY